MNQNLPSANNVSLGLSNRDVITDDDEFDTIRLFGMLRGILFLCQTEIKDISGIIPVQKDQRRRSQI